MYTFSCFPTVNLTWKIDRSERIRICTAAVTLLPVRFFGIVVSLFLAYICALVRAVSWGGHFLSGTERTFSLVTDGRSRHSQQQTK